MRVCIALGVDDHLEGVPARPYISGGDRVTWKVLAEYSWSPTTTQSGSFLCTAASSTPIRVVTKEVRYNHELSLTLEHSMPISSPAALGLTSPRALHSRFLQESSTSESIFKCFVCSGHHTAAWSIARAILNFFLPRCSVTPYGSSECSNTK